MADFETEGGAVVVVGGAVVEVEVEFGAVVDGLVVAGEFGEVVATGVVPFGAVPAPVRAFDDPAASELRFSVADLE